MNIVILENRRFDDAAHERKWLQQRCVNLTAHPTEVGCTRLMAHKLRMAERFLREDRGIDIDPQHYKVDLLQVRRRSAHRQVEARTVGLRSRLQALSHHVATLREQRLRSRPLRAAPR